jgi:hypothetical protein
LKQLLPEISFDEDDDEEEEEQKHTNDDNGDISDDESDIRSITSSEDGIFAINCLDT